MKNHTDESLLARLLQSPGIQNEISEVNAKQAEHYAIKLANMLADASTVALSKHGNFGTIDAEVVLAEKTASSATYYITLNDASTLRPSISYIEHEPVNMLDQYNYGWHARASFIARDRHGKRVRTLPYYNGEFFLQDTCNDFNQTAPSGVRAMVIGDMYGAIGNDVDYDNPDYNLRRLNRYHVTTDKDSNGKWMKSKYERKHQNYRNFML